MLKNNLESQDRDVKKLRAENSRQSDFYDKLWKAYDRLLGETQKLHSRIIILNSSGPAEGSGGWRGSTNRDLEGTDFRLKGLGSQSGKPTGQAGSSGN